MESSVKIDWLAHTCRVTPYNGNRAYSDAWSHNVIREILNSAKYLKEFSHRVDINNWHYGRGRAPYNGSWRNSGIVLYINDKLDHALVEVQGVGCETLRDMGLLDMAINEAYPNRLDIAFDVKTELSPSDVLEHYVTDSRFRSVSINKSDSGETVYIGSRKSERYLVIYRYNEPHPRSDLLRFEFRLRKAYTLPVIKMLRGGESLRKIVNSMAVDYKLNMPVFGSESPIELKKPITGEKSTNKTEYWLITQVIPAIKRLRDIGHIPDIHLWLDKYL